MGEELLEDDYDPDEHGIPDDVLVNEDNRIDETVTLAVADSTAGIDLMLARLFWVLAVVSLSSVVLLPCMVLAVVTTGLAPLRRVATAIRHVRENELDSRIDVELAPDEVMPVVKRLNELLGRVERMVQRERELSADIAHELRTPLAGIRSTVEVCLAQQQQERDNVETLELC